MNNGERPNRKRYQTIIELGRSSNTDKRKMDTQNFSPATQNRGKNEIRIEINQNKWTMNDIIMKNKNQEDEMDKGVVLSNYSVFYKL